MIILVLTMLKIVFIVTILWFMTKCNFKNKPFLTWMTNNSTCIKIFLRLCLTFYFHLPFCRNLGFGFSFPGLSEDSSFCKCSNEIYSNNRSLLAWLCQTWKMLYFTTMKTKNSLAKYHLQFPLYKIYGTNMQLPSIRIRFLVQMTLCVLYTCNGMYALWPNPFLSTCILSDGNVYCMHPK